MKRLLPFLTLLVGSTCFAQITGPLIGYFRDLQGNLRPVYGVAGAFMPGDPVEREVLSASFTATSGLVKKADSLLVYRSGKNVASLDAPRGTATFGFDGKGAPAWVRFEDDSCLVWRDGKPEPGACPAVETPVSPDLPEPVQTIEQMSDGWLAVRTESGIWAVRTKPDIRSWRLPEAER